MQRTLTAAQMAPGPVRWERGSRLGRFEIRRFRPNLVIEPVAGADGFVENAWVGRLLLVGEEVRPQADLPRDVGIPRAAAEHNRVPVPAFGGEAMPSAQAIGCRAYPRRVPSTN